MNMADEHMLAKKKKELKNHYIKKNPQIFIPPRPVLVIVSTWKPERAASAESLKLLAFGSGFRLSWFEPALTLQGPCVFQRARLQLTGTLYAYSYSTPSPRGSRLQLL